MSTDQYIERAITPQLLEHSKYYPVIVVTGPRQSGKSTLVRHAFPDYHVRNVEALKERQEARLEPLKFLADSPMIIDEVQNVPALMSEIQVLVDRDPSLRFVLTGSNNFSLMEQVTQSMAGRGAMFTLLPFSFAELPAYARATSTDTVLFNGFFPGIIARGVPPTVFFGNYYDTYVERDVRRLYDLRHLDRFQTFVRLCAGRVGSEFNASALAGEVGVSVPTIQQWLSVLKTSYVAFTLPPYYANIRKRLTKAPKLYFYDPGLACFLLGIEAQAQLARHPLRGALFENLAVVELMKNRFNAAKLPNLSYYRENSAREVDIVQGMSPQLRLYEVKSASSFHSDFEKNLAYLRNLLGDDVQASSVIYDGESVPPRLLNIRDV